jgi:hypothetical protein
MPFAELKANLSDERFALLAAAGFVELQPGIESFSSDALRKMRKGVTAAQNVHTLVMGRKHGVRIFHNLLMAFRTTSSRNTTRSPSSSRSSSISILR